MFFDFFGLLEKPKLYFAWYEVLWNKGLENPKEPLENAPNAKQHFEKVMPFWDM